MIRYKPYSIIAISALIMISFHLVGCSSQYPTQPKSNIKGKFAFYGLRDKKDGWAAYILENGRLELVEKNAGNTRWSPDGKYLAYITIRNEIVIYNTQTKEKERIKVASIQNDQKTNSKFLVRQLEWAPDVKSLLYTTEEDAYRHAYTRLFKYDITINNHALIKDFGPEYSILELLISEKNKILFIDTVSQGLYAMNMDGSDIKLLRKMAGDISWFPDGVHILFYTNVSADGKLIKDDYSGVYFKMNVDTGESQIIRNATPSGWFQRLSKDGKYLYYSKPYGNNGRYIIATPLDNPAIEIPITKPVKIDNGYSQDLDADWYQGD